MAHKTDHPIAIARVLSRAHEKAGGWKTMRFLQHLISDCRNFHQRFALALLRGVRHSSSL